MEKFVINNVQDSFRKVMPIAEKVAEIFYTKLFEKDPSLKPLFKGDMKAQGKKLMQMLGMSVNGLNNMGALLPLLQDLGRKHVGYGVTNQMYDTVGASLLETLEAGLGENFTTDVKRSWEQVYSSIAVIMQDAAS